MDDVMWSLRFSLRTLELLAFAIPIAVGVLWLAGHRDTSALLFGWIVAHIGYWELLGR